MREVLKVEQVGRGKRTNRVCFCISQSISYKKMCGTEGFSPQPVKIDKTQLKSGR